MLQKLGIIKSFYALLLFTFCMLFTHQSNAQSNVDICLVTPNNWGCYQASIYNPLNGETYHIKYSWNMQGSSNIRATAIWASGNDGKWPQDLMINALGTAHQLESQQNIRSIFLDFIDPDKIPGQDGSGGYFFGLDGYKNAAKTFDLALRHIIAKGLTRGQYLTYISGSNGTNIASFAIAYHGTDALLDQMILNAGPMALDVEDSCFNERSPANFDVSGSLSTGIRMLADLWNGWFGNPNKEYCQRYIKPSASELAERSLLDFNARRNFPTLTIHSIVGLQDEYGLALLRGNRVWFENVNAKYMSLTCHSDMRHEMNYSEILNLAARGPSSVPGKVITGNCADFPSGIANPQTIGMISTHIAGPNAYIVGWACVEGYYKSISVHAYVGGPAGQGGTLLKGSLAIKPTEKAVNQACKTSGSFHRIQIPLTAAERQMYSGQPIYVYGIAPKNIAANAMLARSGNVFVP